MQNYVEAKISEFTEKLAYQRRILIDLLARGDHQILVLRLGDLCTEAEQLLDRTRRGFSLNLPQLFRRHQINLTRIRTSLELLEEWYLPALLQEGHEERAVSRVITRVLAQLQIYHLADHVVSFSRSLSTFPRVPGHPIFFMPRYTRTCIIDWTGVYHEIGHSVYQQFPQISAELARAVLEFCQEQLRRGPALSTSQLNRRAERFRQTLLYWNTYRLEELFCDVFATLVAGPAHLLSWVDVSVTTKQNPYGVDLTDEHPPNAARTDACMLALDDGYADAPLKRSISDLWDNFLNRRAKPPQFNQLCPFALIMRIVESARTAVVRLGIPLFQRTLSSPPASLADEKLDDLQHLVNLAAVNFMFAPTEFSVWQRNITAKVFGI